VKERANTSKSTYLAEAATVGVAITWVSGVKNDLINNGAFLIRENRKIKAEYSRRGSQSANERQSEYERQSESERKKEQATVESERESERKSKHKQKYVRGGSSNSGCRHHLGLRSERTSIK
jgi:hypothetical protein